MKMDTKKKITKSQLSNLLKIIKDGRLEFIVENGKTDICCVFDIDKKLYDKEYLKIKMLLSDDDFLKKVQAIREKYKIPQDGFKTEKEAEKLCLRYPKQWIKASLSHKNFKMTKKEDALNYDIEDTILNGLSFGSSFLKTIRWFILFNTLDYKNPVCRAKITENKFGENEIWLQIFPTTRKQDMVQIWNQVGTLQGYLSDYRGKIKNWKNFERDFEIYKIYKNYKQTFGTKKRSDNANTLEDAKYPIDDYIFQKISAKYPDILLSHIRQIISRFKKRTSDI